MALKISQERIFVIVRKNEKDNVKLSDPNKKMQPEDVMKFYASKYPELTNSNITGPKMKDGKAEYRFQTIIGEKG